VALRSCKVTCLDIEGIERTVQVTAESLYEAVARGLVALRYPAWAVGGRDRPWPGPASRSWVKQPEVEHTVRMRDFEAWLQSNGRSPAEMVLKSQLRELPSKFSSADKG
jgi:hypothetical protein